ncbi:MAG: hypothetical protein PHH61_06455 [Candidatus Nanoarchaeia archaeon]|jgi:DNA-binding MarR family transcriptional regulator|nr:hypothetical protein [Candidatus Nanoarchaeia archaeon]
MTAIGKLEDAQASLRLLIILHHAECPLNQKQLFHEIQSIYKLGFYTMNTAIETCIELGLIVREIKKVGNNPMASKFHSLTPKGKKIAELVLEIDKILSHP